MPYPTGPVPCLRCGTIRTQTPSGAWVCKPCNTAKTQRYRAKPQWARMQRESLLQKRYGLSIEQVETMFAQQGHLCALCRKRPTQVVDHCHTTGRVRGGLCHPCNRGLAVLGDCAERIARVLTYLSPADEKAA